MSLHSLSRLFRQAIALPMHGRFSYAIANSTRPAATLSTLSVRHFSSPRENPQPRVVVIGNWVPIISSDTYIGPRVVIAGQVVLSEKVSVWTGSIVRGDLSKVSVGRYSNIQEYCVLHATRFLPSGDLAETSIGRFVTVGPYCLLRSCKIDNECLIGDKSILMEGSQMKMRSVLEPGSVVPPGRIIPEGQVWGGNPAKFVRNITDDEPLEIFNLADKVWKRSKRQKRM